MRRHHIAAIIAIASASSAAGCQDKTSSAPAVRVIAVDLDQVLDVFSKTLEALDAEAKGNAPVEVAAEPTAAAEPAAAVEPTAAAEPAAAEPALAEVANEDPVKTKKFLQAFADGLNERKLLAEPIGVRVRDDGAVEGFVDLDRNLTMAGNEKQLFWIEVDHERDRIIASAVVEGETHRRPYHYQPHFGGFFFGYMVGRMAFGQNRYYSTPGRRRPNFGAANMSPKGYHKQAMGRATSKARARSARSLGGSRGFSGGK